MRGKILFILILLLATDTITAGGWWNDNWKHRVTVIITENSGKDLEDYQVVVELNKTNFEFEKALPHGEDIRFIDSGRELSYWIEEWDSVKEKAKIWVKIPRIPAYGEKVIYLYYGNLDAENRSDGDETFEFFDDFEEYDIGYEPREWEISCSIVPRVSSETYFEVDDDIDPPYDKSKAGYKAYDKKVLKGMMHVENGNSPTDTFISLTTRPDLPAMHYQVFGVIGHSESTTANPSMAIITADGKKIYDWTSPYAYKGNDWMLHRIDGKVKGSIKTLKLSNGWAPLWRGTGGFTIDYIAIAKHTDPEPTVTIGDTDLYLTSVDIFFSRSSSGQEVEITAEIHCMGDVNLSNVLVYFYDGDPERRGRKIGWARIPYIEADSSEKAVINWTASETTDIYVLIDPEDEVAETDEDNNVAFRRLDVGGPDYLMYLAVGAIIVLCLLGLIILFTVYKILTYKKQVEDEESIECPRCGMILRMGTRECPVCGNEIK